MPEENMSRNAPEPVIPTWISSDFGAADRGVQVLWKPYNQSFSNSVACCSTNGSVAELQLLRR